MGAARHSQALCAAEVKVSGRAIKESGFGSLFLLVDGLSVVDIITLFASAALGLKASCRDAWPLQSSLTCCTAWFPPPAGHPPPPSCPRPWPLNTAARRRRICGSRFKPPLAREPEARVTAGLSGWSAELCCSYY